MEMDANTFASWGVDYLKLDGCNSNVDQYADGMLIVFSSFILFFSQTNDFLRTGKLISQWVQSFRASFQTVLFEKSTIITPISLTLKIKYFKRFVSWDIQPNTLTYQLTFEKNGRKVLFFLTKSFFNRFC